MIDFDPVSEDKKSMDKNFPASMRAFTLKSGGEKLLGTFFIPAGEGPFPLLLLLHGFPGNEVNYDIAHAARRTGFGVAVFHYRGSWGSGGTFGWANCIEDTFNVIDFLDTPGIQKEFRITPGRKVIAGHSMGGFISLYAAAKRNDIVNAGSIAGFNYGLVAKIVNKDEENAGYVKERLSEGLKLLNGTSADDLYNSMLDNCEEWNLLNHVNRLAGKNIYLAAGKYDSTSHFELHHAPLVNAIKQNKDILYTDLVIDTGHSFSDSRIELTRSFIDWLLKIKF